VTDDDMNVVVSAWRQIRNGTVVNSGITLPRRTKYFPQSDIWWLFF